jgi:two-component system response regulator MprA
MKKGDMAKRIQVVEDDPYIAHMLVSGLTFKGFMVCIASTGADALKKIAEAMPDAVLLDVMLPDLDGFEVCRRLRASNPTLPILMLTARNATPDKVTGLDCGADDYITKPFDFDELIARLQAGLRRGAPQDPQSRQLVVGDIVVDPATREVRRAGVLVALTRREYDLLELLARNAGQIVTPAIIFERLWGADLDAGPEVLKVHIHTLRKKLNVDGRPDAIHSVRGVGYMLKA